jgi:hypothetical protein
MDTKQKHAEDKPVIYSAYALKTLMSSAITTYGSAEVALLHIMRTYDFSVSLLQGLLNSLCILFLFSELIWVRIASLEDYKRVCFSKVKYEDIAPFVGLEPGLNISKINWY